MDSRTTTALAARRNVGGNGRQPATTNLIPTTSTMSLRTIGTAAGVRNALGAGRGQQLRGGGLVAHVTMGHVTSTDRPLEAWGAYDLDNPFPLFASVRDLGAVHSVTLADGHPAWLVVGYEEARAALNDPRLSKDMQAALATGGGVVAEGLPGPASRETHAGGRSTRPHPLTPPCLRRVLGTTD